MSRLPVFNREDILAALRAAGLEAGDTAFVSTSLGMLGQAEGAKSADDVNAMALSALLEVVGESGTVLAPTYSYTIGRSRASEPALFDPAMTPGEIGPFPEFLRRQPGALRSTDPMMSIAGIGPACAMLFKDLPPTSYGKGCAFARMADLTGMKCVSIGLGPNWTAFIHHADWLAGVPHRYDKLFRGQVRRPDGSLDDTWWVYSVPARIDQSFANAHRLGAMAVEEGIWRHAPLGRARVYVANYRAYFDFAMKKLAEDPWLLAAGPACDVFAEEDRRAGHRPVSTALDAPEPLKWADAVGDLPLATVSPAMDAAMEWLERDFGITLHRYPTGHNAFDWIVPEKWHCESGSITRTSDRREWSLDSGEIGVQLCSLGVDEAVSAERLARHLASDPAAPDVIPVREEFNDRDWVFCIPDNLRGELARGEFEVRIDARASMGHMPVGELAIEGDRDGTVLLVACVGGQWGCRETLADAAASLELAALARTKGWQGPSLRMLFVPGPVGYAAWLDSNRELANGGNVVGAIHLREIGGKGRWFLHRAGKQGSPFEEGLRASFRVTSGEFHDHSPRFDPLASGHNPIATERLADLSFPNLVLGRSGVETLVDASSHGAKSDITSDANFLAALLEQL